MKRREELRALSEDHHNALVIALRCRRLAAGRSDADPADFWAGVLEFWEHAILPHFEIEETLLLPALEALGEHDMTARILDEHRRLRAMVTEATPDGPRLQALGTLLDDHIRHEERVVFQATQDRLPQSVLDEIERVSRASPQLCPTTLRRIPRRV